MSVFFPRPDEPYLDVEREKESGKCAECGSEELARYPVLGAKGWYEVVKCQSCLTLVDEEAMPMWGFWKPLTADWERSIEVR